MEEKLDIVAIGECLIELSASTSLASADCLYKYYGGDALATAISALRLGSKVGFITKVGNDAFKEFLMDSWQAEGLDISQIKLANEPNGFYFITRPVDADKEIAYYRKKIAPSKLSIDDISEEYISGAKILYSSGTTMSLSISAEEAVLKAFELAKKNNITTAFDPNFSLLCTTKENAKESFNKIVSNVDILFMNDKYDTTYILELESAENIIKKLWDMGVSTIVIKSSLKGGYFTGYNGNIFFNEFFTKETVDTTCSGDAFNGGFMHAITHGCNHVEAVKLAGIVAGLQAQEIGAIKSIPYKDEVYSILRGGCGF
ncbi:pfkB domain protein [Brachyspira sp. CAG:484]|nr:pfkB domain protein [Brachyspira sp. CAG:484]